MQTILVCGIQQSSVLSRHPCSFGDISSSVNFLPLASFLFFILTLQKEVHDFLITAFVDLFWSVSVDQKSLSPCGSFWSSYFSVYSSLRYSVFIGGTMIQWQEGLGRKSRNLCSQEKNMPSPHIKQWIALAGNSCCEATVLTVTVSSCKTNN